VPPNDPELALTERLVLAVLAEGPAHGFAIARRLSAHGDIGRVWTVSRPLVYRALQRLVGARLAEPARREAGAGGPTRMVLRATRRGRAHTHRWLLQPVAHVRYLRSELVAKLVLHAHAGTDPAPLLVAQRATLAPIIEALRDEAAAAPDDPVVAWRLTMAEAAACYVDALAP
jgi:PadR family transcriptional regulator AphA